MHYSSQSTTGRFTFCIKLLESFSWRISHLQRSRQSYIGIGLSLQARHTPFLQSSVVYLDLFNSAKSGDDIGSDAFLDYSGLNWGLHLRMADIADNDPIVSSVLRICNPVSMSYSAWFGLYCETRPWLFPRNWTSIFVLSYVGHEAAVKLLLATEKVDIDSKDKHDRTALLWAARGGHVAIIKLLLATGKADVNSKDKHGNTPPLLSASAELARRKSRLYWVYSRFCITGPSFPSLHYLVPTSLGCLWDGQCSLSATAHLPYPFSLLCLHGCWSRSTKKKLMIQHECQRRSFDES